MAENKTKEAPSNQEIDALLKMYDEADKNVDAAKEIRDTLAEQIEEMVTAHGFMPPRATKSKRIQGDEWKATLSQGQSVEVNGSAAMSILTVMRTLGFARFFRKMFRRVTVFTLAEGAHQALQTLGDKYPDIYERIAPLYHKAVLIEDKSSTLKVEPIKPEKKSDAKKEGKAA